MRFYISAYLKPKATGISQSKQNLPDAKKHLFVSGEISVSTKSM